MSDARNTPLLVAGVVLGAALLVFLNVAALGTSRPWLQVLDVFVDLLVLACALGYVVRRALRDEPRSHSIRAALDESEAQLAGIVDSAMDAIITVDAAQRIVLFNRAAETMFGCARRDAIGDRLDRFIPARFRDPHRSHIERFGATGGTRRRMGENLVLWALRADGTEFPIEASISQAGDPDKRLFTVILRDTTQRKAAEDALRLQQAELRELSARVLEAREEEKTLIARELHDELGQLLTALKLDLDWLRARSAGELAEKAAQMSVVLDRTVGSVRRISADLRPLMLDDLGLADAAAWLVEDFMQRSGTKCNFERPGGDVLDEIERSVATTVYRALQESLTNVARHSGADHAWVLLKLEDGALRLEVEDDGRGMPPAAQISNRSLGLKGMRERVSYHGGTLEAGPAPRGGTRVKVRIPLRVETTGSPP